MRKKGIFYLPDLMKGTLRKPICKIMSKPGSTAMKNEPSFRSSLTRPPPWGYFRMNKDAKGLTVLDDHLSRKIKGHAY
jgi:hypothetical protein